MATNTYLKSEGLKNYVVFGDKRPNVNSKGEVRKVLVVDPRENTVKHGFEISVDELENKKENNALVGEIAKLYFEKGHTQMQVAEVLNVSRAHVFNLCKKYNIKRVNEEEEEDGE